MPFLKPDPTFYPSPKLAMEAPPERLAFVAALAPDGASRPDALLVVDADSKSPSFGQTVGSLAMPNIGDELHHFGWNACSSALCPYAPHPHVERRYLLVPGLRSSRIHVVDTKPDPRQPKLVKVIEPEEVFSKTGYSRPHTIHCGPEGIYVSALGAPNGQGPGGIFLMDHLSFDGLGRWEIDRGPQIPAEPADPAVLPPMLKDFKAVPPLVTDINLSLDDRWLYVACWGTGEMRQYDVSDPFNPKATGSVRIGGIVSRAAHPKKPNQRL